MSIAGRAGLLSRALASALARKSLVYRRAIVSRQTLIALTLPSPVLGFGIPGGMRHEQSRR
jgi:hypothetical protein